MRSSQSRFLRRRSRPQTDGAQAQSGSVHFDIQASIRIARELPSCKIPRRVGPGNRTPSPSQNSGLEPLDSSGSCHPTRAAALRQNRRAPPVASWPIMVPKWIACPLRSADVTPLQRYYQAVRPSASHPYARPRGFCHSWLLRLHRCQGSHVPYAPLSQVQATFMPDAAPSVSRYRRSLSHDLLTTMVSTSSHSFRHGSGSLSFLSLEAT